MHQFMQALVGHWLFQLASIGIGIAGLGAGLLFYILSKREKRPIYWFDSVNVISKVTEFDPKLQLNYKGYGEKIDNFTITKLSFFNAGRAAIRKADIPSTTPLEVRSGQDCKILEAVVTKKTDEANRVSESVSQEKNKISIEFTFLNENDGFELQIMHTGTADSLTLHGTIVDGKPLKREKPTWQTRGNFRDMLINMFASCSLFYLVFMIYKTEQLVYQHDIKNREFETKEYDHIKNLYEKFERLEANTLNNKPDLLAKDLGFVTEPIRSLVRDSIERGPWFAMPIREDHFRSIILLVFTMGLFLWQSLRLFRYLLNVPRKRRLDRFYNG